GGGPAAPGHRRAHHRSQRGADARHRGPRVHHVRRQSAGRRHRARAGVRRPRSEPLPRAHPHGTLARAPRGGPTPTRMKTGLQQHIGLSQQLRINPRLYQAMDLLYMPLLDLQQHLKQELLGNPFLELVEPEEETEVPLSEEAKEDKKEAEANDEPNWEEILLDGGSDAGAPTRDMSEAREYVEPVPVESKDLSDYLREQMRLLDLTPRQQLLAEEFIGNIAEDGYLGATLEEMVRGANQLLEEHGAEAEGDARPPLFTTADEAYIIPDLVVEKIDGEYKVFLNDAGLPRLRISKTYQDIARDKKKFQGENKDFINQRMNSAHWMIQAIEQRRQTMLKVMNFIVDRQRDFFEKGVEYLKPLTLREVADVINMHESTVSRVTNEKYVQTPRGL